MRRAFLVVLGGDLVLVGANVVTYRPFFDQPGSVVYLAEPVVLLVAYAAVVLAVTSSVNADQRRVLRTAVLVGLATGALEIVNISVETFAALSGAGNVAATVGSMVGVRLPRTRVAPSTPRVGSGSHREPATESTPPRRSTSTK